MTDLIQAIAELRRVTPPNSPWEAGDIGGGSSPVDYHIATILNAVLSGDLIPKADADLAVALMVEKAAGEGAGEVAAHGASELSPFVRRRIRALTPASALAELQALRDERDDAVASQFITRVERDGAEDHATETADELRQVRARAEAAEAELATLRAQVERLTGLIQWAHDTLWELNPGNYGHDDVCKVNDAAVEVILGLAPIIGETHGHSVEWWEARAALTEGAAP